MRENHAHDGLQCGMVYLFVLYLSPLGLFPGEAEDHREHGHGHEASESAASAWQSQAVRGAVPWAAPPNSPGKCAGTTAVDGGVEEVAVHLLLFSCLVGRGGRVVNKVMFASNCIFSEYPPPQFSK